MHDPALASLIEDLVTANHILFDQGVLDSFGHVSARHPNNAGRFFMSRAMAPGLVSAADIIEIDLEGNRISEGSQSLYIERYIHSEVYKARDDIKAIVHSHSPTVIPFSITQVDLRPVFHRASFLHTGVPVFEIREVAGARNNMLVNDAKRGRALADALGNKNVALMRGHGDVVVAPSLRVAVSRAIETEVNAKLQLQAKLLGGPINYLSPEEGETLEAELARTKPSDARGADRVWEVLKRQAKIHGMGTSQGLDSTQIDGKEALSPDRPQLDADRYG
jgi:ribulose-5-phosphate 4-epimerase/fuculose-1-phosphate aldolase